MSDFSPKECRARVADLSPQLRETLRLMASGLCPKEIAGALNITPSTAYIYRARVYSRIGVNNLALATRVAVGANLV